jgi:hypothetical protein
MMKFGKIIAQISIQMMPLDDDAPAMDFQLMGIEWLHHVELSKNRRFHRGH